jgi:hypothetical protein
MSGLCIAVPLPPFHKWQILEDEASVPDGFCVIARIAQPTRKANTRTARAMLAPPIDVQPEPEAPGDPMLAELLAAYQGMTGDQRARLLFFARALIGGDTSV